MFPLYHVLADLNECSGIEVVPCVSSAPLRVEALVLARAGGRRLLLANLTSLPQAVELVAGLTAAAPATVRRLRPDNALAAMTAPERFRQSPKNLVAAVRFELDPFEVLMLDLNGDPVP